MNYLIIIGTIIFILILIFVLFIVIKKLRKKQPLIDNEVINDFNNAEKMLADSKGEMTPQEVLINIWDMKNKNPRPVIRPDTIEPIVKKDYISTVPEYKESIITKEKPKKINLKKLFRR